MESAINEKLEEIIKALKGVKDQQKDDFNKLENRLLAFEKSIIIDNKLNWKLHIKQINLKLSKGIGVLYKLRHLVPKHSLKCLYSSFIQSHVLYGILNWGCANRTTLENLKCNLRKAVRVIDFANYTAHSEPIFQRLKILNFDKLYMLETAKMMFQVKHNEFSLENEFIKTKNVHKYNTRQS